MTEASPSPVFYGSAKAEQVNVPKKESKVVSGVRKAVDSWLERIGPKGIEKHFVKAHENVLATLNSDQRKEVFAKEAEKWRKQGKILGIAATTIDAMLIGAGAGLSFIGWNKPEIGANLYADLSLNLAFRLAPHTDKPFVSPVLQFLLKPFEAVGIDFTSGSGIVDRVPMKDDYHTYIGRSVNMAPAMASLGILMGSGPGHWLAHLAAGGKEHFGKMKARTHNYVDSGKAAEHAAKVGNVLGKAATETAKYVAEHPDEIRKTVETVSRVKRQNAESAQKLAEAKQKAADIALEKEYQDWITHHPDKAYYENSGHPYPSKADYVAMKNEAEAKQKANKETEKRGMAKDSPKN